MERLRSGIPGDGKSGWTNAIELGTRLQVPVLWALLQEARLDVCFPLGKCSAGLAGSS